MHIIFFIVITGIHTVISQYPNHMDFQKVGEVSYKNEKYNVLKPSLHVVTDYFKDFVLRRTNNTFPNKRVFIDRNGFRHYWTSFEATKNDLRKSVGDENTTTDVPNVQADDNTTDAPNDNDEDATDNNVTADVENIETTTTDNANVENTVTTTEHTDTKKPIQRKGPKRKKKLIDSAIEEKPQVLRQNEKGGTRTMATTTFFCPFFGIITMNAFID